MESERQSYKGKYSDKVYFNTFLKETKISEDKY